MRAWQEDVRNAAMQSVADGAEPTVEGVELRITYYFDESSPDVDNIVKPIQDALIGLVYVDDSQVMNVLCRKRDINGTFRVKGMSPVLAQGFVSGLDFLHIEVVLPQDLEEVRR